MGDLGGEELEEPVELVGVAAERWGELGRIRVVGGLDRPHLHLQPPAEALDTAEDAHRVALAEALVEQVDVAPDARLDATARVCELEREVGRARSSAAPLLLRDREHALDGPVLGELGDRGHVRSLWLEGVGTLARMADVQPFRAVRYSGAAGSLADLVAPPYDAVDPEERERSSTRSPYNVVHLTLPESAEQAAELYRDWLADGILEHEDEPAAWLLSEEYVGPDGIARERRGVVVSLAVEPYETGHVLPHERTHPRIRDERLRLLRAIRVQPEPIFLLAGRARSTLEAPDRAPDLEADGSRLWRLEDFDPGSPASDGLLIADGHHRYESAAPSSAPSARGSWRLLVSTSDPGLHVFPTHRTFSGRPDLARPRKAKASRIVGEALALLANRASNTVRGRRVPPRTASSSSAGAEGELDVELVDRYGLDGIGYTSRAPRPSRPSIAGMRTSRSCSGRRVSRTSSRSRGAASGCRPKSTYFFPKPLSGLLFHPLDP